MFDLNQRINEIAKSKGWKAIPLKYVYKRKKELGDGSEKLLSIYRDHGVVPKNSRSDNFNKASDDLSKYQKVQPGDLVINKMKAWQGSVAISDYDGIISPAYFIYEPQVKAYSRYIHYLLRSEIYFSYYASISSGVRPNQWDLDPSLFERINLLLPPFDEQKKIADELDRELAEIDDFIADQQQLKFLLKEKLDASIEYEMWDQNLDLVPLKYVASVLPGFAFKSSDFSENANHVPLLRGINVGVNSLKWNDAVYLDRSIAAAYQHYQLQTDDLVLGLDRPVISSGVRVAKINESEAGSLLVQRVARIRTYSSMTIPDWVQLALNSSRFTAYLEPIFTGVSVPHISPDQLSNFKIPLPPLQNQLSTSRYFQNKLNAHKENTIDITTTISLAEIEKKLIINNSFRNQ